MANHQQFKILVANWKSIDSPDAGGAERVVWRIATDLSRFSKVYYITRTTHPSSSGTVNRAGKNLIVIQIPSSFQTLFFRFGFFIRKRFSDRYFDFAIESVNTSPFFLSLWMKRTPVVSVIHQLAKEIWFFQTKAPLSFLGYYFLEPLALKILALTKALIVVGSKSTADDLIRHGIDASRITQFNYGIRMERGSSQLICPTEPTGPLKIVFVGAFRPMKQPHHIVHAMAELRKRELDATLSFVGGTRTEMESLLGRTLQQEELQHMKFMGRLSETEKQKIVRESHIALATSTKEGWGLVVTEAHRLGTLVVTYDVDGLRDANEVTPQLICSPTPTCLAEAIFHFDKLRRESPQDVDTLKQKVYEWSLQFTEEASFESFVKAAASHLPNSLVMSRLKSHPGQPRTP